MAAPRGVVPLGLLAAGVLTLGIATAVLRSDERPDQSARRNGTPSESPGLPQPTETPEPTLSPDVSPTPSPSPSPTGTAGTPGGGAGEPTEPSAPQMPETGGDAALPLAALVAAGSAYGVRAVRRAGHNSR